METPEQHPPLWNLFDRTQRVDTETFIDAFARHLEYTVGKYKHTTTNADVYQALAYTIRDKLIDRWNETDELYRARRVKKVYYLSLEFLIGRLLDSIFVNLGVRDLAQQALRDLGYDPAAIVEEEPDAGLGNGGLGRLAACFLESAATLDLPFQGCSLRYEFGIFRQQIVNGYQKEAPDTWLAVGNPWELRRGDLVFPIHFYGHTERADSAAPEAPARWIPGETVFATAHDLLVPGFNTRTVNALRLWAARSSSEFNLDYFNHGDYVRAVEDKQRSEVISKVLYPSDHIIQGRELRLKQEYLLVSATLQDALASFRAEETDWSRLPERAVFQLNDTHPALAAAELMRLLVDVHRVAWRSAWDLTIRCLAYTNHTVMPEALETWGVDLLGRLLPRHLEIVYLINQRFLDDLRRRGVSEDKIRRLSLVDEGPPKRIRMANLALAGSHAVNGVAALHTEILKGHIFREFHEIHPERFQNKTNGITHRRWLASANPDLSALISSKIGRTWLADAGRLRELEAHATDPDFQNDWQEVRLRNKERLAAIVSRECGVAVDPRSLFDVQVKRIHEYKRQHLNVLRVIGDYHRLKADPAIHYVPRTVLFAGKSAPSYRRAKLIIKLISSVAELVNHDPAVNERLRVAFLPDYRVSLAERIFPASDLSEQISTAGTEASGTGNMKFMLNGALTIGTLDGANIEILEEVGEENMFIFGHSIDEVQKLRHEGYDPRARAAADPEISRILEALRSDELSPGEPGLFQEIHDSLAAEGDPYLLIADYRSYVEAQQRVSDEFERSAQWLRKSILNSARSGRFSSDRTVTEYARDIWSVVSVKQRPPRISAL